MVIDPAVVRSGRVKKAVANAVQQEGRLPTRVSASGREDRRPSSFSASLPVLAPFGHLPVNVLLSSMGAHTV